MQYSRCISQRDATIPGDNPQVGIRSGKSVFSFIRGTTRGQIMPHSERRGWQADIDRRSQGRLHRWARFGEACSRPYSYSYFKTRTPRPIVSLNTLCRMRRLAYNVAALRLPPELVMARWQQPFARRRSTSRSRIASPLRCVSREVQFAPDINSGNGLLVNVWD